MKTEVLMPMLGEGITEGTIVRWWKKPGDFVKKDETLLEISTDKVDSEIPSPHEGKVVEIKAQENETVAVNTVIAIIDAAAAGAEAREEAPRPAAAAKPAPVSPPPAPAPAQPKPAPASPPTAAPSPAGAMEVEMPMLGEGITEGTIVRWWKKPGDFVKKDETLLEISTDKVDSEIPSPFEGTVLEILAAESQTVTVGSVIAKISAEKGAPAAEKPTAPDKDRNVPVPMSGLNRPGSTAPAPASAPAPVPQPADKTNEIPRRESGGRFFSPLVRNIARAEGIGKEELAEIPGTGLEGRVTKQDILSYLETRGAAPIRPAPAPATASRPSPPQQPAAPARPAPSAAEVTEKWQGERVEVLPMDAIRKKIAEHMVLSKQTSPHVYGVAECDFTAVLNLVSRHKNAFQEREGFKLTINPFILYAVTRAAKDFPGVNASVEGYNVIRKRFINIGMAVATERGLIVPVLKNADELNFTGIARTAYDLAIRARDKKLNIEDVQGSTLTVTNYGVFGNIIGFPIINQPNVAIMGVGAIKKRPVVIETEQGDMIGIRAIGFLTLSYDHRIVDGELGDKYLQRVRHYLETFEEAWM